MNKISVKLNQDYKQFKAGFSYEFEGDLIIISGINGSGKSQLVDIINQSSVDHHKVSYNDYNNYKISSEVLVNDRIIDYIEISRRSFKDNIAISNINSPKPQNVLWHKDQAWKYYTNPNMWKSALSYSKSKAVIENAIKDYASKNPIVIGDKINNDITEREFKSLLPDDFRWVQDDLFSNCVEDLFYEFAAKRHDEKAKLGCENGGFDNNEYIKNAPWTILNNLFDKLGFDYRFQPDFDFITPNLSPKPMLYPLQKNGKLNYESPRELSDLSDGEKTIISLTFASLNEDNRNFEKILLLDEFDNTLNPSLIEALYTVLDEFFVNKGVSIIMTTHSPATISMAPDYANFYEIFKNDKDSPCIVPVEKYQYEEMKFANKKFYEKIKKQSDRIEELENDINALSKSKILLVEDKYTELYKVAWLKTHHINFTQENLEEMFSGNACFDIYSKANKDSLKGYLANPAMDEWNGKRIVGLFDFDDAYTDFKNMISKGSGDKEWEEIQGETYSGLFSKRKKYPNVCATVLPIPSFRENIANINNSVNRLEVELLFKDKDIKDAYKGEEYSTEIVISDIVIPKIKNKQNFWIKVINLPDESFQGFIPLFDRIEELLEIEK